jgi:membrane protein
MAAGDVDITERALRWAQARGARLFGHNPWALTVRTLRSAAEDRVTGLAAEMAFFGILSLLPMVVAVGAALGFLERLIGVDQVTRGQQLVLQTVDTVLSPQVTRDVIRPLIDGLLTEQRGGVALSSILIAVFLASRVFTAMIRALDLAYNVEERRNVVVQRLLALGFAIGFVLVLAAVLTVVVAGPLVGGGRQIAEWFGLGELFTAAWSIARWPIVLIAAVAFFATLYHFGPNITTTWRRSLPGAVLGVLLWIAVSLGLRVYLAALGTPGARFTPQDDALAAAGSLIGAMAAFVIWSFVSGVALLLGGELNSELAAARRQAER